MDEYQKEIVTKYKREINSCLEKNIAQALYDFAIDGVGPSEMSILALHDIDAIRARAMTPRAQAIELIRVLQHRDTGFKAILAALQYYGEEATQKLAKTLEEESSKNAMLNSSNTPSSTSQSKLSKPWPLDAPRRNDEFVDQQSFLQKLEELQNSNIKEINQSSQSTKILAVCVGLGGVGKSSIAIEFMYRNLTKYEYVIWVPATTHEGIEKCLAQLGEDLRLPASNSKSVIWKDTLRWLQANPGWLIIYDDAQNYRKVQSYIPRTGGYVLVTSRYKAWHGYTTITITPFSDENTTQYLKQHLKELPFAINDTDSVALAEALGNLPLAITQATAYMSLLGISVQEYLTKLKTAQRQLLSKKIPVDSEPIYVTWSISLEQAKLQCSFAADLLAFCSLLDRNYVPYTLICEYAKLRDCWDVLDDAQTALFSYSLMTVTTNYKRGMSMHPLVQAVTKSSLSDAEVDDHVRSLCICIKKAWPNEPKLSHNDVRDLYTSLEKCWDYVRLDADTYGQNHPHITVDMQYEILLITVYAYHILGYSKKQREILTTVLPLLKNHYGHNSTQVAVILGSLGNAYGYLGDHQKQKDLLEQALRIKVQHYGPEHVQVAITLENLSNAYGSIGNYQMQVKLLEQVLPIIQKHYGSEHPQVAITLSNVASAYGDMGDYQKQQELLEKAILIQERHYGPEHVEVATTLSNLSCSYSRMGDFQKKKNVLERALPIIEKYYNHDHVQVAATLGNLATAYGDMGDHQKQRDLLERALAIEEKHYGPEHFEVAITLRNLSNAYSKMGNYQKQLDLLEQALLIQEKYYGPYHEEVAKTLRSLGNAYDSIGDYQKQKNFLERALSIQEQHYGPYHINVARTLGSLANAYGSTGNYQEQKKLLERALSIKEQHYGPDHVKVTRTLVSLGDAYGRMDNYRQQKNLLERALLIQEQRYGFDYVGVATTLTSLAKAYDSMADYQKQRELLDRALLVKEQHYGPDHVEVTITIVNLGCAYSNMGDYRQQKKLLERALLIQKKHYAPDHAEVVRTLAYLGIAYSKMGVMPIATTTQTSIANQRKALRS